jgi:hypothetical protein
VEDLRVTSADGRLDAIGFTRNCGATIDYNTEVAVVSAGNSTPYSRGIVFIAPHKTPVRLRWRSNDTLEVRYPISTPDRLQTRVRGVTVVYGALTAE